MNSKLTIQLLIFMIVLLLLFVFVIMSQQMSSHSDLSSPHDHVNNNNFINHNGNMSPENLRGRFRLYDLGHPTSNVTDPIDKQSEPAPEPENPADSMHVLPVEKENASGEKNSGEGDSAKGDDVLPSFLEPRVMPPSLQELEHNQEQHKVQSGSSSIPEGGGHSVHGSEVGGQQEAPGMGVESSPTMSNNDHILPNLGHEEPSQTMRPAIGTDLEPTTDSIGFSMSDVGSESDSEMDNIAGPLHVVFPLHESFALPAATQRSGENRLLFQLYTSYWKERAQPLQDDGAAVAPHALLDTFHSALKHGRACEEEVSRVSSSSSFTSSTSYHSSTSSSSYGSSSVSNSSPAEPSSPLEKAAYWEVVAVQPSLFVEFSASPSCASLLVSLALPATLSVLLDSSASHHPHRPPLNTGAEMNSNLLPSCAADVMPDKASPPSNVILSKYPLPSSFEPSTSPLFNSPLDCVQLVSSIEAIFTSTMPLPFEVENDLGVALCRCNTTILPSRLPSSAFFSYWNDMDMLIAEAASAAVRQRICHIQVNDTGTIDTMDGGIPSFPSTGVKYAHRTHVYDKSLGHLSASDALALDLSEVSRSHLLSTLHLDERERVETKSPHTLESVISAATRTKKNQYTNINQVKTVTALSHDNSASSISRTSDLSSSILRSHARPAKSNSPAAIVPSFSLPDGAETTDDKLDAISVGNAAGNATTMATQAAEDDVKPMRTIRRRLFGTTSYSSGSSIYRSSSTTNSSSISSSYLHSSSTSTPSSIKPSIKVKKDFGAYGEPRHRTSPLLPKSHWILPNEYSHNIQLNREILEWIELDELLQTNTEATPDVASTSSLLRDYSSSNKRSGSSYSVNANKRSSSSQSSNKGLPTSARLHQKAVLDREGVTHFQRWMAMLHSEAGGKGEKRKGGGGFLDYLINGRSGSRTSGYESRDDKKETNNNGLVYVFGRYSTLISIKLAKMLMSRSTATTFSPLSGRPSSTAPLGVVVSLLTDSASWMPHRDLADSMGLQNNFLCHGKLTLETIGALSVAPEQPNIVLLQLDIFTSLLQKSLSHKNSASPLSPSEHDDTLDVDTSAATFPAPDVEENASEKEQKDVGAADAICSRAFDLFEELVGTVILMGDAVYMEVPHMSTMYNIVQQVSPSCFPIFVARYSDSKEFLAAVSATVLVSKQASTFLCGSHAHTSHEIDDEKCLHLEVKAVEPTLFQQLSDDHNNDNHSSNIYRFKVMYYSHFDFQLMKNVSMAKNIKDLNKQIANKANNNNFGHKLLLPVLFSISLKELKTRLHQINHENKKLSVWSRARQEGVSVYTLLHLGVEPVVKRLLLKQYIDFPFIFLHENDQHNLSPWQMFVKVSLNIVKNVQEVQLDYISSEEEILNTGKYHRYEEGERGHAKKSSSHVGVSSINKSIKNELQTAQFYFEALQREFESHIGDLAQHGHFSFVEHNSEYGFISAQIAQKYSNASVVSLERDAVKMKQHVRMLEALKIENNVVCSKGTDSDSTIFQRIYESPELFRYQLVARGLLESFSNTDDTAAWGSDLGCLLSSALTTFLAVPSSRQVSLAMSIFFPSQHQHEDREADVVDISGPYRSLTTVFAFSSETIVSEQHTSLSYWKDVNSIRHHPVSMYRGFETLWLLGLTKAYQGTTELSFTPVYHPSASSIPLFIRCDLRNMTRHVHHHYDYAKDGHSRTYTMRVEVNHTVSAAATAIIGDPSTSVVGRLNEADVLVSQGGGSNSDNKNFTLPLGMHPNQHQVVSVNLLRDKDSFPIPYTSIYGITLISILRLGIDSTIRDRLFRSFLFLPLYEDMAPWNIVLMGKEMAYIDYDTRDVTFDLDIPKAYQVISVLMNYKRTVEDFKRCGRKANTVYGLAFISDCVGEQRFGTKAISCPNLNLPVPCGDGTCHSDYISCLRSYSDHADALAAEAGAGAALGTLAVGGGDKLSLELAQAMRSGIGMFSS